MPPLIRFSPGDAAPWRGTYALVGHFGEVTGFAIECDSGDKLPLVAADADLGQLWFVHMGEAISAKQAA